MAGLGPRSAIERTEIGNSRPTVVRACALLDRVKRCRVVKDRIRLWKDGVRDLVMEICCALHTFRVRLTPWQPMV
jgi:hypothetical protein